MLALDEILSEMYPGSGRPHTVVLIALILLFIPSTAPLLTRMRVQASTLSRWLRSIRASCRKGLSQRGRTGYFHNELKLRVGLERMPCGETNANVGFFQIGALAYNLFIGFKRLACTAAWAAHTIATVRWRLTQITGRIIRYAWQGILKLVVEAERWLSSSRSVASVSRSQGLPDGLRPKGESRSTCGGGRRLSGGAVPGPVRVP